MVVFLGDSIKQYLAKLKWNFFFLHLSTMTWRANVNATWLKKKEHYHAIVGDFNQIKPLSGNKPFAIVFCEVFF